MAHDKFLLIITAAVFYQELMQWLFLAILEVQNYKLQTMEPYDNSY